jgi:hypothetical protein
MKAFGGVKVKALASLTSSQDFNLQIPRTYSKKIEALVCPQ